MDTEATAYGLDVQKLNLVRSNDFSSRFHMDTDFGIYPASSLLA
jgi:hypothetical protein